MRPWLLGNVKSPARRCGALAIALAGVAQCVLAVEAPGAARPEALDWPLPVGAVAAQYEPSLTAAGSPPPLMETPLGLVVNKPGVSSGFTLFTNGSAGTFLIDNAGQVAHQWEHALVNAKLLPNGNVIGTLTGYLYEMDPQGQPAWEYEPSQPMHHDYLKLPNGNVLLLLTRNRSAEEAIAAGANPQFVDPERGLTHDELVEVRPTYPVGGEVVWRWSVWDHLIQDFDRTKANYGDVAAHPERVDLNYALAELSRTDKQADRADWLHANALDYHAELDQVLISARNFSEIWVVDHSVTQEEAAGRTGGRAGRGGDLLYRWGNPRAHRAGTTAEQRLFWPHSAHWIPPGLPGAGNILVFNNGDEFEGFERNYSTVVEFEYPVAAGKPVAPARGQPFAPARPAWEYVGDPPASFFSQRTSSVQRLANGNTLVLAGLQGTMFEVTPGGEMVWQYINPLDTNMALSQGDPVPMRLHRNRWVWANMLFRVRKYAPDHPGLAGLDLAPKGALERERAQGPSRIVAGQFLEAANRVGSQR